MDETLTHLNYTYDLGRVSTPLASPSAVTEVSVTTCTKIMHWKCPTPIKKIEILSKGNDAIYNLKVTASKNEVKNGQLGL